MELLLAISMRVFNHTLEHACKLISIVLVCMTGFGHDMNLNHVKALLKQSNPD